MCFLTIFIYYLKSCQFESFAHFKIGLFISMVVKL